jgi:sphinganine-1-phosphate aldolase
VNLYPFYILLAQGRTSLFSSSKWYRAFTFWAQYALFKVWTRAMRDVLDLGIAGSAMALVASVIRVAKKLPFISQILAGEQASTLESIEKHVLGSAPDCGKVFLKLPDVGLTKGETMEMVRKSRGVQKKYDDGVAAGGIYHYEKEELTVLQGEAMSTFSCTNALYPGTFPGIRKMESEIVSMVLHMMNGDPSKGHCGCLTSGGTESVLMAMLAHREYFRDVHGIHQPEIVACTTAHAALDKACHYFGIKLVHTQPDPLTMRASVSAFRKAITNNTICLYVSAPSFPHGTIDPVVEVAALAKQYGVGCHVDNCLGGFLLSHMKLKGYLQNDQNFDLTVPGVTSISVDVHKYGNSSKGTSVVLYSDPEIRRGQYTTVTDWLGGLYCTTGAGGSRGGGPIASAWVTLVYNGIRSYTDSAELVHETFMKLREEIPKIKGLRLQGSPAAAIIAYTSDDFDIYKVADEMSASGGWEIPRMQRPPCLHICVSVKTPSVVAKYLADLRAAVAKCRDTPALVKDGLAGIYGQASIVPDRSVVGDILKGYLDVLYKPQSAPSKP